jgi:2-polyprenyl-3-methyl-5-hydroxy-6-metoxy-1,4-benzoquinol methylase
MSPDRGIQQLQRDWDGFGKDDPLWRVLSLPEKKGKWGIEDFFQTGRDEIDGLMAYLSKLDLRVPGGRALDFGCGVGRLSQALANHFETVYGVDIAPSMIDFAKKYNKKGEKCQYVVNSSSDLRLFADGYFDFIYSNITLQHIPPKYSTSYISEFLRILKTGGVAVFQLPAKKILVPVSNLFGMSKRVFEFLPQSVLSVYHQVRYPNRPFAFMYSVPRSRVEELIRLGNATLMDVQEGPAGQWMNCRYCVKK